jgi:PPOX class F420-dependent enzyme/OxyR family protein
MRTFSPAEVAYLGERRIGRLATVDGTGQPHVVPVGMWRLNTELGVLDVTGRAFSATKKFRNVEANPTAAFVVDDMASTDPWRPRAVMIQGTAAAIRDAGEGGEAVIRIKPDRIVSWGLEDEGGASRG